jgi:hypothetical protein
VINRSKHEILITLTNILDPFSLYVKHTGTFAGHLKDCKETDDQSAYVGLYET